MICVVHICVEPGRMRVFLFVRGSRAPIFSLLAFSLYLDLELVVVLIPVFSGSMFLLLSASV